MRTLTEQKLAQTEEKVTNTEKLVETLKTELEQKNKRIEELEQATKKFGCGHDAEPGKSFLDSACEDCVKE